MKDERGTRLKKYTEIMVRKVSQETEDEIETKLQKHREIIMIKLSQEMKDERGNYHMIFIVKTSEKLYFDFISLHNIERFPA
jgi:hypothetical protein